MMLRRRRARRELHPAWPIPSDGVFDEDLAALLRCACDSVPEDCAVPVIPMDKAGPGGFAQQAARPRGSRDPPRAARTRSRGLCCPTRLDPLRQTPSASPLCPLAPSIHPGVVISEGVPV